MYRTAGRSVLFSALFFNKQGKKEKRKLPGLHGMDKILFDEVKKRKGEDFIVLDKAERAVRTHAVPYK